MGEPAGPDNDRGASLSPPHAGQRPEVHDAHGVHPGGKLVSLLAHSHFRRVRFHQVKGTNSPWTRGWRGTGRSGGSDPCLAASWGTHASSTSTSCGGRGAGAPSPGCYWRTW